MKQGISKADGFGVSGFHI